MTNFTTLWGTNATGFTRSKWRHVVVVNIATLFFTFHVFNELSHGWGTECSNRQYLSSTTLKETRTVHYWENIHFSTELTNLVGLTTIWPNTIFKDHATSFFSFQIVENILEWSIKQFFALFTQFGNQVFDNAVLAQVCFFNHSLMDLSLVGLG